MRYLFVTLLFALSAHALTAPLNLNVNLMMDGEPLEWDATYTNAAGQDFTINLLKFYISNVALVNADGSETPLDGLELASFEAGDATSATIMSVDAPAGSYSGIRFDIGVPRELNHLDATLQEAPLGVDAGMYWAWNPGYIFYRIEGQVDLDGQDEAWLLHMGTDAFRLPVRIQDLLTGTVTIEVPAEGAAVDFELELMDAFSQGINAQDYDFSQDAYRAVHGGPVAAQAYTNLLNAVSLTGADAAEAEEAVELDVEAEDMSETAHNDDVQGDEVQDDDVESDDVQDDEAEMDHSDMQDDEAQNEMDHGDMDTEDMDTEDMDAEDSEAADDASSDLSSQLAGGSISGTVSLPDSVETWDSIIVLACTRTDAEDRRCDEPVVTEPNVESPDARDASFTFEDLPAGEYGIYALNDKDGNESHTMQGTETEEMGAWVEPGTFNLLYVSPPTTGISLELIGAE